MAYYSYLFLLIFGKLPFQSSFLSLPVSGEFQSLVLLHNLLVIDLTCFVLQWKIANVDMMYKQANDLEQTASVPLATT